MPAWGVSNSISAPVGHPLPGNSASSAANPVETVGPARVPSCDPRQSAGCSLSSEADVEGGEIAEIGIMNNNSNNTVQIYSIIELCYHPNCV